MKTICQECKTVMIDGPEDDDKISHGLCEECAPDFMRRGGMSEEEIKASMKELAEGK